MALSLLLVGAGLTGCSKTSPDFVPAFAKDAQPVSSLRGQAFFYNIDRPYDQTVQEAKAELLSSGWQLYPNTSKAHSFQKPDGKRTVTKIVLFKGSYTLDSLEMAWVKPGEGTAILHLERAPPGRGLR